MSIDAPLDIDSFAPPTFTVGTPRGLPFLGTEVPRCAATPDAASVFAMAGDVHMSGSALRTAVNICHECPYFTTCGDWAISNDEGWGVWGGMTPKQRQKVKRRTRRIAALSNG